MNAPNQPEEAHPDAQDTATDLDDDQQKAFDSIMAQIENGELGSGDADREKTAEEPEAFSAELEKVAQQAETQAAPDPAESDAADPDDELDEDQQKAFESIMAQIESGETDADTEGAKAETGGDDDFSAELEKVAQQAETQAAPEPAESDATDPDDELDEDQQKAFESIMAQIESGETDADTEGAEAKTGAIASPSDAPEPEDVVEIAAGRPDVRTVESGDTEAKDPGAASDDIDGIIKEITSTEPESDGPASVPASGEQRPPAGDQKEVPSEPATAGAVEPAGSQASPPKTPPTDSHPAASQPVKAATPLPENKVAGGGKKKSLIIISMVALALAAAGGLYFHNAPGPAVEPPQPSPPVVTPTPVNTVDSTEAAVPREPMAVRRDDTDLSRLKTTIVELNRLRQELIDKQTEINDLQSYYRAGIESETRGLMDLTGSRGGDPVSFSAVQSNPRIILGLQAIQRRSTYIDKLAAPAEILHRNSEELFYYSRKGELLSLMVTQTSDIDVDGFIAGAEAVMAAHRETLMRLNIDAVPATPKALAAIWNDVNNQRTAPGGRSAGVAPNPDADNAAIWNKICEGDFTQKHRLTDLSPQAARCLAEWKGKDLFLNNLTDLSPEAARHLATWPGDWLGLNGLTELTPDVAVHLARWKGRGLSLNGLDRLSPRVVAILSEWQGRQIELINVKHMAHWENPNTRLFLSDEVKRKLSTTRK
jgi:hypothetical protein